MRFHKSLLLTIAFTCIATLAMSVVARANELQWVVEGTWSSTLAGEGNAGWRVVDGKLICHIPPYAKGKFTIVCKEPLPDGNVTVDFWSVTMGDMLPFKFFIGNAPLQLNVEVEPRKSSGYVRVNLRLPNKEWQCDGAISKCAAGRIYWVRTIYNVDGHRIIVRINGHTVFDKETTVFPTHPIGFTVEQDYITDDVIDFRVVDFRVRRGVPKPAPLMHTWGQAFNGWSHKLNGDNIRNIAPTLIKCANEIISTAKDDEQAQAFALGLIVIVESALHGKMSDKTWMRVQEFVKGAKAIPATTILPIAVACGTSEQREQAKALVDVICDKARANWKGDLEFKWSRFFPRLEFLDRKPYYFGICEKICARSDLTASEREVAHLAHRLAKKSHRLFTLAELLPEAKQVAPRYAALMLKVLKSRLVWEYVNVSDFPYWLRETVKRLMRSDIALAMQLCKFAKKPSQRAELMQMVLKRLRKAEGYTDTVMLEAALQDAIKQWRPSGKDDSIVPLLANLARVYIQSGQLEKASKIVREAEGKVGRTLRAQARDYREIAKLKEALKHPDASTWWRKAEDAAIKYDADAGSEFVGAGFYMAATTLLVEELVKHGHIKEALKMIETLEPDAFPTNTSICYLSVIHAIALHSPMQASKLIERIPKETSRINAVALVTAQLAKRDPARARELVFSLPPHQHPQAALTIGAYIDLSSDEQLLKLAGEAIRTSLQKKRSRLSNFIIRKMLSNRLKRLSPATLLALKPYFGEEMHLFAKHLLMSVGNACSLKDDEMWKVILVPSEY